MEALRVEYDPRFIDFMISEAVREYILMKTTGHTGPYGEPAVRRAIVEDFAGKKDLQASTMGVM